MLCFSRIGKCVGKNADDHADIGMVYRDPEGKTVKTGAADDTYAEEGAVTGAVAGAVLSSRNAGEVAYRTLPMSPSGDGS